MSFFILFVLLASFFEYSSSATYSAEETAAFDQWKEQFKNVKIPKNVDSKQRIAKAFRKIKAHNDRFDKGETSHYQKLWKYSFLDETDRVNMTNGFQYLDIVGKLKSRPGGAFRDSRIISMFQNTPPPMPNSSATSLDWRDYGIVTPVQDQGYYCASCYTFSATGALEAQIALKTGNLVKLSEQQLIDCNFNEYSGNWGCWGGYMTSSYAYLVFNGGIAHGSYYPYQEDKFPCRYNYQYSGGSVQSFVSLQAASNETVLKNSLISIGPLAIAIDANHDSFYYYGGGVYYEPECTNWISHAMLLVGFGTDPDYGDYWLIKNSWGPYWGEDGYMKLKRNANNHCGIGTYVVYPVVPN